MLGEVIGGFVQVVVLATLIGGPVAIGIAREDNAEVRAMARLIATTRSAIATNGLGTALHLLAVRWNKTQFQGGEMSIHESPAGRITIEITRVPLRHLGIDWAGWAFWRHEDLGEIGERRAEFLLDGVMRMLQGHGEVVDRIRIECWAQDDFGNTAVYDVHVEAPAKSTADILEGDWLSRGIVVDKDTASGKIWLLKQQ